jgi:starch phosphorylase
MEAFIMSDKFSESWQVSCRGIDADSLKKSILNNLEYRLGKGMKRATEYDKYLSVAYSVIERMLEKWILTQDTHGEIKPKRLYYLSMEFLMGRTLGNGLINLGLYDQCHEALQEMGMDLEELREIEVDAALGNGGLGRLAACFLDSLATLGIPAFGYGIRYDYGLFHQKIIEGRQAEIPDNWLSLTNPWEIARPEYQYRIRFGGHIEHQYERNGTRTSIWREAEEVYAMAYDTPTPGYDTNSVNTLRLWAAKTSEDFNLQDFNSGDYFAAVHKKVTSENISKVLYPDDSAQSGKELRLRQEYFLVSATLQDVIYRFKREHDTQWKLFPTKVAIQLNDTHPALAIPELMRILVDDENLKWDRAWKICFDTFGYTNHTLLPEALEVWPVAMMDHLLPRHMEIIYLINHNFMKEVMRYYPGQIDRMRRMSIINEDGLKSVRMAHLAVAGSHKVNGVAALHSQLMTETIFGDFAAMWPEKFTNMTNGVTPRRWLRKANQGLSHLITSAIGEEWVKDLTKLRKLEPFLNDAQFRQQWREVKHNCKLPLIDLVQRETGVILSPYTMFDVQVKRMHEYKRQLLFALFIIAEYLRLKDDPNAIVTPRTCIISGKAAPAYHMAKLIILFINRIADTLNNDIDTRDFLRLVFVPNYRVSAAEKIIPAANLSEQISTAGKEASGTGNMKFALNGAITMGTLDGANVEILGEVGKDNIFIFGHTAPELMSMRREGYDPQTYIEESEILQRVLHLIDCDFFSPGEPGLFRPILDSVRYHDEYFVMADFEKYLQAQNNAGAAYRDEEKWTTMSILNVARSGVFSSDSTINEYAKQIWDIKPLIISSDRDCDKKCPKNCK